MCCNEYVLDIAAYGMWQRENCDNEKDSEAFKKIVTKAIQNELNEKQRKILYLYYYEKLTMKKIAELLDISVPTVCNYLKRIRQKLYGCLKYAAELYYGREMKITERSDNNAE